MARPALVLGVVAHSGWLARLPGPGSTPEALSRAEVGAARWLTARLDDGA